MEPNSYYDDRKYCPQCQDYRRYLMSVSKSFCVECGGEVRLFSKEDWEAFNESLKAKKPKGRRVRRGSKSDTQSA